MSRLGFGDMPEEAMDADDTDQPFAESREEQGEGEGRADGESIEDDFR